MEPDFSGWASKAGLKCTDGRTIQENAFAHQDKVTVPLVWQHMSQSPDNILGHAILYNRPLGVWTEAFFNDTPNGQHVKGAVQHGDIKYLSIFANGLDEDSRKVVKHGNILEVSLCVAGANPGAVIETVSIRHSDNTVYTLDDEAIITTGLPIELKHADGDSETIEDVLETFNEKQEKVLMHLLNVALATDVSSLEHSQQADEMNDGEEDDSAEDGGDDSADETNDDGANADDETPDEGDLDNQEGLQHMNVFDKQGGTATQGPKKTLSHDQITTILEDAKKPGMTLKASFLAHAVEYGIENIDFLFPDAQMVQDSPEFIARRTEWVARFMAGTKKSPFSRIKTMSVDITHDEARAKGYVKGNLKKEEWFGLAKRVTTPTTIYKKQKLDRDDIIDATTLDVVAWMKAEMRVMIDEEVARAALVGDGREPDDDDKIDETCIRPIAYDSDFYTHKIPVAASLSPEGVVEAFLRGRTAYRGSGSLTAFMPEGLLIDMLLEKNRMGQKVYPTQADLEREMRVKEIVPLDIFDGSYTMEGGELLIVAVDLRDYTMGADRGGQTAFFDDFDIDYNQYKYLYEGRMSGALTRFKSAIAVYRVSGATLATPTIPTFVEGTGVVTIPTVTGVVYKNAETDATLSAGAQTALDAGESLYVEAVPATGYFFAHNTDNDWTFTRPV